MTATMEITRAYLLVLDPNASQTEALRRHAGAARWAFNWALAAKIATHHAYNQQLAWLTYTDHAHLPPEQALAAAKQQLRGDPRFKTPTYVDMGRRFTQEAGDDTLGIDGVAPWRRSVNRYAITSGFQNADAAWKNWCDSIAGRRAGARVGYPRFKKRGRSRDSFALFHDVKKPGIRVVDARHLRLPTIGTIRLHSPARRLLRKLERGTVTIKSARISRRGHRWTVALLATEQIPAPATTRRQTAAGTIGVDLGVKNLAALSTGELVPNPRRGALDAAKIARLQRRIARCHKDSHNREKLIQQLARAKALQAERRHAALHQLTKRLAAGYAAVAIEDLNVAGMTRSAKGTLEAPGRNVRAKSGLNREILDSGFGEFRRQLTYKTSWYASRLHVVDRYLPSSKTCSRCGNLHPALALRDRTYHCPACGLDIDRDLNAALNLAAAAAVSTPNPAKPTPAEAETCTTPDTRDTQAPEAKIGTPGETTPTHTAGTVTDPGRPTHRGSPPPSNRRGLLTTTGAHHP